MAIRIEEIGSSKLTLYESVPSRLEVKSVLEPELVDNGLGGILLREIPIEKPYIKDYDSYGELPREWPQKFDVHNWVFLLAMNGKTAVGAATVAFDTSGVFMLEGRRNLSVLWDIRVCPEGRGAGIPLLRYAADWSRAHGCKQMKIETQNVNVPACRFYQRMGGRLGVIHQYEYSAIPAVAHEVMLCWYIDLAEF